MSGSIRFWNPDSGSTITLKSHTNTVSCLAFAQARRNDYLLTAGYDGAVGVWDVTKRRSVKPQLEYMFQVGVYCSTCFRWVYTTALRLSICISTIIYLYVHHYLSLSPPLSILSPPLSPPLSILISTVIYPYLHCYLSLSPPLSPPLSILISTVIYPYLHHYLSVSPPLSILSPPLSLPRSMCMSIGPCGR
jgi:WD40 repeat protein